MVLSIFSCISLYHYCPQGLQSLFSSKYMHIILSTFKDFAIFHAVMKLLLTFYVFLETFYQAVVEEAVWWRNIKLFEPLMEDIVFKKQTCFFQILSPFSVVLMKLCICIKLFWVLLLHFENFLIKFNLFCHKTESISCYCITLYNYLLYFLITSRIIKLCFTIFYC